MEFYSGKYNRLEFLAKRAANEIGWIALRADDSKATLCKVRVSGEVCHFHSLNIQRDTRYRFECNQVEIPYVYLCGNEDLFEEGTGFLDMDSEQSFVRLEDVAKFHDSPIKEQYHFVPFKNWLNDPNGLCFYKNHYHMFYQANPVEQKADFCYWGHAVSKDLVHWSYLPLAVFPQQELLENRKNCGGAYSGSAIIHKGQLHIFFTRHVGKKENLQDFCEYQVKAVSNDGIRFENETIIIASRPEQSIGCDFRDPKVTELNGCFTLVLAGAKDGKAAMMIYHSTDLEDWQYDGILLMEKEVVCFECPDLYELDGKVIATAALMDYVDENGRFRPTKYYIGQLLDGKMLTEQEGIVDFGLNFYAAQSFQVQKRRVMIGWIADFNCEHVFVEEGCYGSMSIPREVFLRDEKLCMRPIEEIYQLKGKKIEIVTEGNVYHTKIEGNSYYAAIELEGESSMKIMIARDGKDELWFLWDQKNAEIYSSKDAGKTVRYFTKLEKLYKVEIFFDRRVAEVFLNEGEAVGTRLFYSMQNDGFFSAEIQEVGCLKQLEVCKMNSGWKRRNQL